VSDFCSVVLVDPGLSHFEGGFTYRNPAELTLQIGSVVRVPFNRKRRIGVVVGFLDRQDVARVLPVHSIVGPGIDEATVSLAVWTSQRYLSTPGEAFAAVLPSRVASEETIQRPMSEPVIERALDLGRYEDGDSLRETIESGSGGCVWQPAFGTARADEIVAMISIAASKGGVLVLVPEIRAGDVTNAIRSAFGNAVAYLGSDASARARYGEWLALRSGAKRIAVGGRASVFAPVQDLRLIVVDDEGHQSYKEGRAPRYHARAVAAERARRERAAIVFVGVPPSVEARAATERGPYTLVAPVRASERGHRPAVTIVEPSGLVPDARTLRIAARQLNDGRRALFLAHRGGSEFDAVAERTIRVLKPKRPARLDARSTPADLARAVQGADCIVATPFIAKDVTFENAGALAILDVDAALSQPEYRSSEEAFATWWRAARSAEGGHLVIETRTPGQPAVAALTRWDPDMLYRAEVSKRRELGYPPFAAVARIDAPSQRADAVAVEVAATGVEVLGPIEREGRAVVVARAALRESLLAALRPLVQKWRAADEPMRVDVDPWEVFVPKWRS
jgi:primosomal protein N' (replication factor Y)